VNEVVLSGLAESDLADIWAFVAQDDHVAAERLIEEVLGKFRMLAVTPKAGRKRPELGASIRSLAVGSYVIFYREGKRAIEVARVLHGRRDITAIFRS
jgi:toxin ParE1/3/4